MSTILRQRMIEDLRIRNYSPKTIDIYVRQVASFAKYFGKSPHLLGTEEIRKYQVYLVEKKKASWAVFNQTVSALRFLYRTTLNRNEFIEQLQYPRQETRLPVILSPSELSRFFRCVSNLKYRTVLKTLYGGGLRLNEGLHLKIPDIDSSRMLLRVEQGKGRKDRYVELSPTLLHELREYCKVYMPEVWLFPGRSMDHPLHGSAVQRVCTPARLKARIEKPVMVHTMRHCYATHQLESGTDLRTIQLALGHSSLSTTAIYLHVAMGAKQSSYKAVDLLGLTEKPNRKR